MTFEVAFQIAMFVVIPVAFFIAILIRGIVITVQRRRSKRQ